MTKIGFFYILFFGVFFTKAQVSFEGETYLGNKKITDVIFTIKSGGITTQTFQTTGASKFTVEVAFGRNYEIHLKHPDTYDMFFEIKTDNIPKSKYDIIMIHECDLIFYSTKNDSINPKAFSIPFYRAIFNGKKHIIEDINQSNIFKKIFTEKQR